MNSARIGQCILGTHLWLSRFGLANALVCMLWGTAAMCALWLLPQLKQDVSVQRSILASATKSLQAVSHPLTPAPRPVSEKNLADFLDALGETRYVEQQVKTLFAIAVTNGMSLTRADYKTGTSHDGGYQTYQVILPVKGSYLAIRQFCDQTLLAIPFASLDEIGFKRETIANRAIEANLRLTFYLLDKPRSGADVQP